MADCKASGFSMSIFCAGAGFIKSNAGNALLDNGMVEINSSMVLIS